jgi:hypothetical protein
MSSHCFAGFIWAAAALHEKADREFSVGTLQHVALHLRGDGEMINDGHSPI